MRSIVTIIGAMFVLDVVLLLMLLWLTRGSRWKWVAVVFMTAQAVGLLWLTVGRLMGFWSSIPTVYLATTYIWHFLGLAVWLPVTTVVVLCFVIPAIARLVRKRSKSVVGLESAADTAATTTSISRRQFLGAALSVAPVVFTGGLTGIGFQQLQNFRVRRFVLPIANLPRDLAGLTIAHVSDMHVGRFTSERALRKMVQLTNDFHADLVLVTGDLINNTLTDLSSAIDVVRSLQSRFGTWVIEGNHDLIDNGEEFRRRMRASGLRFLLGQSAVVPIYGQPVQFLGVPWVGARRFQPDERIDISTREVLWQRLPDAFPILLGHHPHVFDAAAAVGVPLTLAGHTHGGQFMVNEQLGCGPAMFRYWTGHYQKGDSHLIVSNGIGNWFPLRINAPAELVHITLAQA